MSFGVGWIVAAALVGGTGQTSREAAGKVDLERLEQVWNEAHLRGDAEILDDLWADDFVVTVPGMALMTKSDVIGSGAPAG